MAKTIWSDYPLLLISHGESIEKHIIYNVSDNRYHTLNFPALNDKKVLGSSHGWLVLAGHGDDTCSLFNPISGDVIALPALENACWYYQCILTKPPTEPDCYVLFNGGANISFCRIGDEDFVKLCYCPPRIEDHNVEDYRCLVGMGYFQGQIYGYMIPDGQFVTIHFLENTLEFRPLKLMDDDDDDDTEYDGDDSLPWIIPFSSVSFDVWFIESPPSFSNGAVELLMVYKVHLIEDVEDHGFDFRVFRINTDRNTCTEIVDIGKRTIFLSNHGCGYCCNSIEGIKPNSVYYTNPHTSDDTNLYVFDLKDRSTTSRLPSRDVGPDSFTSWVHITN